jgi:peroxiredoxin/uncharacterized membrane protein
MGTLASISSLLLSAVLLLGSVGKFLNLEQFRRSLNEFGFPREIADYLSSALPAAEFLIGVGLLFPTTSWWSAALACSLFACFGAVVSWNLYYGRRPACNCFGQLTSSRIGKETLLLNAALIACSIIIIWSGRHTYVRSVTDLIFLLTESEIVIGAVAIFAIAGCSATVWFLLRLLEQNGRLIKRIEVLEAAAGSRADDKIWPSAERQRQGLAVGAPAPNFSVESIDGKLATLRDLIEPGKQLLLVFIQIGCGPCTSMIPSIRRWQIVYSSVMTVVVISNATRDASGKKIGDLEPNTLFAQKDSEVFNAYQSAGTPSAIIIDNNGRIRSRLAQGPVEIEALVRTSTATALARLYPEVGIGSSLPDLAVQKLSGEITPLSTFCGNKLLILFWNPSCGYCSRIRERLADWENRTGGGNTSVLIVSQGSVKANEQIGLRSPIVLDDDFLLGRVFGATGTPSAVLVDERGLVASAIVVGGDQVLSLLEAGRLVSLADRTILMANA